MIGYKVLTKDMKSICSTFSSYSIKKMSIEYKYGEYNYPAVEGTKLFAFRRLEDAKKFVRANFKTNCIIYKVDIKNPGYTKYISSTLYNNVQHFWKCKKNKKQLNFSFTKLAPKGTISCSAIKLLELVE